MRLKKIFQSLLAATLMLYSVTILAKEPENAPLEQRTIYNEEKLNIVVTADHPEFTIQLKSNPTTGYSWFLREYDSNLITPVKQSFQKTGQKLMGAPGYEVWVFRAKPASFVVPQQTTLRMIYARPWQGADSSTQLVFRVTMTRK